MDAARILGGLLSQRAGRGGAAGAVLGQVLNGIAQAKAQQSHPDPRFDAHHHHSPLENIVRESVSRHHHAGGRVPPNVSQWADRHGSQFRAPQVRQRAPKPRHDDHDRHQHDHPDHHSGLGHGQRVEVLIQAMIMAAQADGQIDAAEQDRIIHELQPLDRAEADYLRREFSRRHDLHAFVHDVPRGMEYEVYQVSLMAMDLDTRREADYLRSLAECLRITPQVCNEIHHRGGATCLYS